MRKLKVSLKAFLSKLLGINALANRLDQLDVIHQQLDVIHQQTQALSTELLAIKHYLNSSLEAQMTQLGQSSAAASKLFNHSVESTLNPHHKSVFWGDRLLSLDKSQGFLQDPKFLEVYEEIKGSHQYDQYLSSGGIAWRLCTLVWAAQTALNLPGDFVECGVFKGDMSWVIIHCLDFATLPRQFYLYDTFTGLAEKYLRPDDYEANPGYLELSRQAYSIPQLYETVRDRFQPWPNVKVIQGILPDALTDNSPQQIAFLHIDLNSPLAEIGVLEALFDRVVPGGVIVFDDYGWVDFQKQKLAEDAWMQQRGYTILELPTGQGLVVKR